ncbi:MAG: GAF domain-containing protein [Planctomycetota bacterium]|nr:GAF domain-containing protein [Planctomycetota bacterium]
MSETRPSTRILRGHASSMRLFVVPSGAPLQVRADAQEQEIEKLHLLLDTARELSGEISLDLLMKKIVERTSRIMDCERSSVFLLDAKTGELYTLIAQGLDAKEVRVPVSKGLAGFAARTGRKVNVPDAYADERFNPEVDRRTGYRTRTVLAMPLRDHKGEILGVIQCLNKLDFGGRNEPFNEVDERFLEALTGLLATFLESAKLYRQMDVLFASFVSAMSRSIDDRDPCTSGHSRRVTLYSLNLARAVHDCERAPFKDYRYTRERLRQLLYAGLLHDIGKIGVREYILCKADKLPVNGAEVIRARLERLGFERRVALLERALREQLDPAPLLKAECEPLEAEVRAALGLVEAKNRPGFVKDEELKALEALRDRNWLTPEEFRLLSVRKGNLTPEEWVDMRNHVVKSYEILLRIPGRRNSARCPKSPTRITRSATAPATRAA